MGRILVVDDEAAIRVAMAEFFALQGYVVRSAGDASEAKAHLAHEPYAVVIADLQMSGQSAAAGLDLLHHVRAWHPATRIIVLTACGSPELETRAMRCGVDTFLHKPQPLPTLAKEVERLLHAA